MELRRIVREMETGPKNLIAPLTGVKVPIFYDTRWVARNTKMAGKTCHFGRYGR
jgi:hypothetical protein